MGDEVWLEDERLDLKMKRRTKARITPIRRNLVFKGLFVFGLIVLLFEEFQWLDTDIVKTEKVNS